MSLRVSHRLPEVDPPWGDVAEGVYQQALIPGTSRCGEMNIRSLSFAKCRAQPSLFQHWHLPMQASAGTWKFATRKIKV
jgi:hypothetical protein